QDRHPLRVAARQTGPGALCLGPGIAGRVAERYGLRSRLMTVNRDLAVTGQGGGGCATLSARAWASVARIVAPEDDPGKDRLSWGACDAHRPSPLQPPPVGHARTGRRLGRSAAGVQPILHAG